jgi:hypothetical protein
MGRPCHVYDYHGEHLASFADWDSAHGWAHLQAALSSVSTPIEVEDRHRKVGRRVWADRCEQMNADEESGGDRTSRDGASREQDVPDDYDSFEMAGVCAESVPVPAFSAPLPRVPR